jgi:hypothetical protein
MSAEYRKTATVFAEQVEAGRTVRIDTLEGPAVAEAGDWLVTANTDKGEQWIVRDEVFRATYVEVTATPNPAQVPRLPKAAFVTPRMETTYGNVLSWPQLMQRGNGQWWNSRWTVMDADVETLTPLAPVPSGHVVIDPAALARLADDWRESAQATTNTDQPALARRAVYLRCADQLHATLQAARGLATEAGEER